ncbi:MAG: ABC transporter permease [Chloroflexi bacterium]|nr:ABC transporter permease [Chloroflexota bacterium]
MNLWESLRVAWGALASNKLRALLTMLGVIIGVAAVISMVAIGAGAQERVARQFKALGTNLLFVQPGKAKQAGVVGAAGSVPLTEEDAWAIAEVSSVRAVAPETGKDFQVTYANKNTNTRITGTTPEFAAIRNFEVARGRFLIPSDLENGRTVAVLGAAITPILFGEADPLGETVRINKIEFTLVGVLAAKGVAGGENRDDQIIVPLTTAQKRLFGSANLRLISVQAASPEAMDDAALDVTAILRRRHRLAATQSNDFEMRNQADLLSAAEQASGAFTMLLGSVAAVSLLVGGIGIMNIMLVSVSERTHEIGLRKAVGAKRRDILAQFLVEAIVLSMSGGLVGIAAGIGLSQAISDMAGWATLVSHDSILLAFGFSVAIGLFFGLYPARRAALLSPMDALRYE